MEITWYGHASFGLVSSSGIRIITDPYTSLKGLAYGKINESADVVTISHNHWDHASIDEIGGSPYVIRSAGKKEYKEIYCEGFNSFHDPEEGRLRGDNIIFKITADDLTVVHMGDIGHVLDEETAGALCDADVVMIPVGGVYTIGPQEAGEIVRSINPRIVVPMHYANDKCPFVKYTVNDFSTLFGDSVIGEGNHTVTVENVQLKGRPTILVLDSAR